MVKRILGYMFNITFLFFTVFTNARYQPVLWICSYIHLLSHGYSAIIGMIQTKALSITSAIGL